MTESNGTVHDLSPPDLDDVVDISLLYLSELEISENMRLFRAACSSRADGYLGVGIDVDSGLAGFLIGTVHDSAEPLDRNFNRPTPVTTDVSHAILQHLYLRPDRIGRGHGSALLEEALERSRSSGAERVYCEAWIRPDESDAVPLLERYGFAERYHDPDYWAHDGFFANVVPCPTHDVAYADCSCEGAVYEREL